MTGVKSVVIRPYLKYLIRPLFRETYGENEFAHIV